MAKNPAEALKLALAEPQACPKCGAPAQIQHPKPRLWAVACSKNSELTFGHKVSGWPMHTKREAIAEWNKLTSE